MKSIYPPPEAGKLDYPPPDFVPDPPPWSFEIYDPPAIFDLPGGAKKNSGALRAPDKKGSVAQQMRQKQWYIRI